LEALLAAAHGGPLDAIYRIHPFTANLEGYDLGDRLDAAQAQVVRDELLRGDGDERSWQVAKGLLGGPVIDALMVPTVPPTLFCFERCLGNGLTLEPPIGAPIRTPLRSPQNALDFVRRLI
jgi:hypothetical protein